MSCPPADSGSHGNKPISSCAVPPATTSDPESSTDPSTEREEQGLSPEELRKRRLKHLGQ